MKGHRQSRPFHALVRARAGRGFTQFRYCSTINFNSYTGSWTQPACSGRLRFEHAGPRQFRLPYTSQLRGTGCRYKAGEIERPWFSSETNKHCTTLALAEVITSGICNAGEEGLVHFLTTQADSLTLYCIVSLYRPSLVPRPVRKIKILTLGVDRVTTSV